MSSIELTETSFLKYSDVIRSASYKTRLMYLPIGININHKREIKPPNSTRTSMKTVSLSFRLTTKVEIIGSSLKLISHIFLV